METSVTDLALVIIRINVDDVPHLLLVRGGAPLEWQLVGTFLKDDDAGDWHHAASRACNSSLAPLRLGRDFFIVPLFTGPTLTSGLYRTQVFSLQFIRPLGECIGMLPSEGFCLVPESLYSAGQLNLGGPALLAIRALGGLGRVPVSSDHIGWSVESRRCPAPTTPDEEVEMGLGREAKAAADAEAAWRSSAWGSAELDAWRLAVQRAYGGGERGKR